MLPPSLTSSLANNAIPVIAQTLRTGGTFGGTRLAPPANEVEALKLFLLCVTPAIAARWRSSLGSRYRMTVNAVLCHQTPRASHGHLSPAYHHRARMPAQVRGKWTCELADLLVVMEFPVRGSAIVLRQAGLVQGKTATPATFSLSREEHRQHHLLSCWPGFTLSKSGGFAQRTRWLRGLAPGAGCYGLIDAPSRQWSVHVPLPAHTALIDRGEPFGEWLAELATGQDGAPADLRPSGRSGPIARSHPPEWPLLVDELLRITARRGGVRLGGVRSSRGQSHIVRLVDASGIEPEMIEYRLDEDGAEPVETSRSGGGRDAPADRLRRERTAGGISVLHMRFDPAGDIDMG